MEIPAIIEMLRNNDPSAAPILVSVLGPQLYPYAAMIAPDLSQADQEDAVEDAIAAVAARIDDFDEERGTLQAWARGFVRNTVRARRSRQPGGLPPQPLAEHHHESVPNATANMDRDARLSEVVLTRLTDAEYLLLRLRLSEQLPHAAIAERFGVSEEAVKKRYQRLIAKLADAVRGDPLLDPSSVSGRSA